jgi:hypothetical protein
MAAQGTSPLKACSPATPARHVAQTLLGVALAGAIATAWRLKAPTANRDRRPFFTMPCLIWPITVTVDAANWSVRAFQPCGIRGSHRRPRTGVSANVALDDPGASREGTSVGGIILNIGSPIGKSGSRPVVPVRQQGDQD